MKAAVFAAALAALLLLPADPALAAATGPPGRYGPETPSAAPILPKSDPLSQFTIGDLDEAIKEAGIDPPLVNEQACFSLIRNGLAAVSADEGSKAAGLATLYVRLIRINQVKQSILASDACLAVCGRATSIISVPILGRAIPVSLIPTLCSILKQMTN